MAKEIEMNSLVGKIYHNTESGIAWIIDAPKNGKYPMTVIQTLNKDSSHIRSSSYPIGKTIYSDLFTITQRGDWVIVNTLEVFKVLYARKP